MAVGGAPSMFSQAGSAAPYIYPPPLMGRFDDPFFGFVPPLVSFPPWWRRSVDSLPQPRPGPVPQNAQPRWRPNRLPRGKSVLPETGGRRWMRLRSKGRLN